VDGDVGALVNLPSQLPPAVADPQAQVIRRTMTPTSSSLLSSSNDGDGKTTTIEEKNNNNAAIVSEPWTRIFPEKYGIRQSIEDSSFRWCVRESMMWGVATGAMMGVHRLRMKSNPFFVINVAFGTALLVAAPSYYFCYRRREHQEQVIEMMMAVNDFRPGEEMPESVPLDENHPFLNVRDRVNDEEDGDDRDLQKEFVARLKEKKDWQEPHQTRDLEEVFQEVKKKGVDK